MSLARHTTYNIVGALLPLGVLLVTFPMYLGAIGEARYGVLVILWTLLGYFGLFDLGLGRAVTNRIAALGDAPKRRAEVLWTALGLNAGLSTAGALLLWLTGAFVFQRFVDAPDGMGAEVAAALPWLAASLPLLIVGSVLSGALQGREAFLSTNVVRILDATLTQVAPLVVALMVGPSLPGLVLAVVGARLITSVLLLGLCVWIVPLRRLSWSRTEARFLLGYGGWVSVTAIVGPLMTTLDRVVIGALAGAAAVTLYAVPFSLASRVSILPGAVSGALFPRLSAVSAEERSAIFRSSVRVVAAVLTPLIVLGMLLMEPFLAWWVDAGFAERAAPVGEMLLIGLLFNCISYLPYTLLQAEGRPGVVARIHLMEVLPYFLALGVLLSTMGIVGAAVAFSARVIADAWLLFRASRTLSVLTSQLAIPTLLVGGSWMLTVLFEPAAATRWGGAMVIGGATITWAWRCLAPVLQEHGWLRSAVATR